MKRQTLPYGRFWIQTLSVLGMMLALGACSKKKTAATTVVDDNPTIGVVDNTSFWVRARTTDDFAPFSKSGTDADPANSFGWVEDSCEVPLADAGTTSADKVCYIEAEELDLNFWGLDIQHNVPASMCQYVTIRMPWFYQYPVGQGPTTTSYTVDTTTTPPDYTTQPIVNYSMAGTTPSQPFCPYNYTTFGYPTGTVVDGLPNCCYGSYTDTVTTVSTSGSTGTPNRLEWGGKPGDCINGPALEAQTLNDAGFPVADLFYVGGTGLNGIYTWKSVKEKGFLSNLFLANYFTSGTDFDDPDEYPAAFVPANNAVPTPAGTFPGSTLDALTSHGSQSAAQPYAEYICWNRAREANARIRVFVRSWDTISQIGTATSYGATPGSEPNFPSFPLHDYEIWDDNNLPLTPGTPATNYPTYRGGYPGTGL